MLQELKARSKGSKINEGKTKVMQCSSMSKVVGGRCRLRVSRQSRLPGPGSEQAPLSPAGDCAWKGCRVVQILQHHQCFQSVESWNRDRLFNTNLFKTNDIRKRDVGTDKGRGKYVDGGGDSDKAEDAWSLPTTILTILCVRCVM